jgi:hypothetical protein
MQAQKLKKGKNKPKKLNIGITYDPDIIPSDFIENNKTAQLYNEIFRTQGSKNIFFDDLVELESLKDEITLFETVLALDSNEIVLHCSDLFKHQARKRTNLDNITTRLEATINKILVKYCAPEGICEGLRPYVEKDLSRKRNHRTIGELIGVPTINTINASELQYPNINNIAFDKLKTWTNGVYLKMNYAGNGKGNIPMIPSTNKEFTEIIKVIMDVINMPGNEELLVVERKPTPHPKFASHYGVFTFFNGQESKIMSGILCYNLSNPYTIHGNTVQRIPLTGSYVNRKYTLREKEIMKKHNLSQPQLPKEVSDIAISAGNYAGINGRLFLCTEIIQDTEGKYYLMDVNAVPGFGAIKTTEFPKTSNPNVCKCCKKITDMVLECYK